MENILSCHTALDVGKQAITKVMKDGISVDREIGEWCLHKKREKVEMLECHNVILRWNFPELRINPKTTISSLVETEDTILGLNKDSFIRYVLPIYNRWHVPGAGFNYAYGHRIQYHNQLENLIEGLRRDKTSRQFVITIWSPKYDLTTWEKFVPCPVLLNFQYYSKSLHMTVVIRSQDCVKGGILNLDTFLWSTLLGYVCFATGIEMGTLSFVELNLHIYPGDMEKADKILAIGDLYGGEGTRFRAYPFSPGSGHILDNSIVQTLTNTQKNIMFDISTLIFKRDGELSNVQLTKLERMIDKLPTFWRSVKAIESCWKNVSCPLLERFVIGQDFKQMYDKYREKYRGWK